MTSKKKKHKKSSRILLIKNILFVFQIVISILLVGAVILSGMLPARYIVALTVFLVLLVLVSYTLLNRKEKIWMAGAAFAAIVRCGACSTNPERSIRSMRWSSSFWRMTRRRPWRTPEIMYSVSRPVWIRSIPRP